RGDIYAGGELNIKTGNKSYNYQTKQITSKTTKYLTKDLIKRFESYVIKDKKSKCWNWQKADERFSITKYIRVQATHYSYYLYTKKALPKECFVVRSCLNNKCVNPDHLVVLHTRTEFASWVFHNYVKRTDQLHTKEVRRKIGLAHRGKKVSEETKQKLRLCNLGNKHTPETRAKMTRNRMGIRVKPEARKKIAFTKYGEKNYNTRLTEKQVREIINLKDKCSKCKVAKEYGISYVHVFNIQARKVWKHIDIDKKDLPSKEYMKEVNNRIRKK
ncbi:NUMOD3 domain-containing DNA-binding protein, partial [Pseudomonadota bacterium]